MKNFLTIAVVMSFSITGFGQDLHFTTNNKKDYAEVTTRELLKMVTESNISLPTMDENKFYYMGSYEASGDITTADVVICNYVVKRDIYRYVTKNDKVLEFNLETVLKAEGSECSTAERSGVVIYKKPRKEKDLKIQVVDRVLNRRDFILETKTLNDADGKVNIIVSEKGLFISNENQFFVKYEKSDNPETYFKNKMDTSLAHYLDSSETELLINKIASLRAYGWSVDCTNDFYVQDLSGFIDSYDDKCEPNKYEVDNSLDRLKNLGVIF